ncbi:MAG: AAA family ATPase [Bdellovibrio sp.]|nr:AAA family ATPase [Bdellovibrio sp.]
MNPKTKVAAQDLIKMIQVENRAEYFRYKSETEAPLSLICDRADALGPLKLHQKIGFAQYILRGEVFYSRFRPGDRVDIRTQKAGSDYSDKFSDGWRVDSISYPSPGKIEVVISGVGPFEEDGVKEVFLFKSSSTLFNGILIRKISEMSRSDEPILLGNERRALAANHPEFKRHYNNLNDGQKIAVHSLIGNNLTGAIQGPPGTGKTQLLRSIISLGLSSNMKVGITSLTNAAVDNLLGRIVSGAFAHDWVRVGDADRVNRDLYHGDLQNVNFVVRGFSKEVNEIALIASTLHKLAFNWKSAPKFDLLVIDEAGQVPIYFWPFIQRMTKRLVLVGDQFQLPPVLSAEHVNLPANNIFALCVDKETPMLETQYRMRREIQAWSSEKFYKGRLLPHKTVVNRDYFAHHPAFLSDGFVVPKKFDSNSTGKGSQIEADFIVDKVEKLVRTREDLTTVGVICPYRAQAGIVNASLQNRLGVATASRILVDTVERFQGQEREAIFLSFGGGGNSQHDLRFLSDPRRLNVAVTRAKSRFFCLFDEGLLERSTGKQSEDLNEFLRWVSDGRVAIRKAA